MKNEIIIGVLVVGSLGLGVTTVSALTGQSKAEKLAELTGKSVSEITSERYDNDKTYGEIANENGVLEEFKAYNYEHKKSIVEEKVNNGLLTEEEAKDILKQIEERQANCDGTGNENHNGLGLGNGHGQGSGQGYRNCQGRNCNK